MLLDRGILMGRKNKIAIGFDLGDRLSQISFSRMDGGEPETLAVADGEEVFCFPTVIGRQFGAKPWVCGIEAADLAAEGKGVALDRLVSLARAGNGIEIDGELFDPVALLMLFLKRSLSLPGLPIGPEQIAAVMITVDILDRRMTEVLNQAAAVLQPVPVFFQSRGESFYQYMLHQPRELWLGEALACEHEEERLRTYCMVCNRRTTPAVVFVEEKEYQMAASDEVFRQILEETCRDKTVSSAYLLGRSFEKEWYGESLRYLCRGRRVFRGNNLYSKGACYGAAEKLAAGETARQYVFLGRDTLKANLGMKVLRGGQDSYFALLNAGTSWFEARVQCEFYLESGNSLSILVMPLTGRESKEVEIILHDLPKREERATRIRMELAMESEESVSVTLEDLGFGEIYPATHRIWHERFVL